MRSLEALVTDRQWEAGEERTGLIFEVPALVWGSLGVGGKCVELGAWRLRGQRCGAGQPRAWGLELGPGPPQWIQGEVSGLGFWSLCWGPSNGDHDHCLDCIPGHWHQKERPSLMDVL